LHKERFNNLIKSDTGVDDIPFYPYFFAKDLFAFFCFLFVFAFFIFYFLNVLNHSDNCIPADSLKTPAHVVPEWYFLPFYAVLRSIPDKLGGVIAMGISIVVLGLLPLLHSSEVRSAEFRPLFKFFF
jgi:ubiquinol-cytochrome c reductase cytochrome b subunit